MSEAKYKVTGKRWPITRTSLIEDKIKAYGEFQLSLSDEWDLYATRYVMQLNGEEPNSKKSFLKQLTHAYHLFYIDCEHTTAETKAGFWFTHALRNGVIEEVA